ncbi:hypothetical protein [Sneathiella chinensis]|uniref:Solute-binding protein family 3/N-terminal domain-containing protein n=1 Tax=Sneathiella chinensis TaxID=349750 RepID=A0ABQ5U511_9PROT|nr:hypothetical protein [Sneathiella chinensis]GLQ06402.1 hypothetical protein GCM10007924_16230 [Sneathiella chinensis]
MIRVVSGIFFLLLAGLGPMITLPAAHAENLPGEPVTIRFLTYHNSPPFIINEASRLGMTFTLADTLSARSNGQYYFKVEILPRKRLDLVLKDGCLCVVPWVNPEWFNEPNAPPYPFTDGYQRDSNAVISRISQKVEYKSPFSLYGLSVAGLQGTQWGLVDTLVARGLIIKEEVPRFFLALKMVVAGRADAAILPTSIAAYLIERHKLASELYISSRPHSVFARHFLVSQPPGQPNLPLYQFLQAQVPSLLANPPWDVPL